MQALLMSKIGELQLVETPEPRIERPDDTLVEVRAAGICGSDLHGYTGQTGRRRPPLVMGHEAAGVVLETGSEVTGLTTGTRVAIHPLDLRGPKRILMGMDAPGAYAERVVWPAANLYPLPDEVSFEAGSLAEPLAVTIHALGRADMTEAKSAVVVGAGPIGLLVASLLKHRGVELVAVTDLSDERLAVAKELGVDAAINPSNEDPAAAMRRLTDGDGVDVAFEAVGTGATVAQAHALTREGGTVVWIGNNLKMIEVDMQEVVTRELSVQGTYGMNRRDFAEAIELLAAGAIRSEVLINRRAKLREGPKLFDELLASPSVVKCVFSFPEVAAV
jgi:L-iditol 2-dehydrogenase